jgi:hypothetical protein
VPVPPLDPQAVAQQALEQYDTNKDGAIAGAELDACPGLKSSLEVIDTNKDGRITADEIAARITQYKEDKAALFGLSGHVTLDGRPLEGATVTLMPEKFMGTGVKPARCVSDAKGECAFVVEGHEFKSVANPGVYRIEVSKKDSGGQESIPARYNAKTTLGVEIGQGSPTVKGGSLDLALTR